MKEFAEIAKIVTRSRKNFFDGHFKMADGQWNRYGLLLSEIASGNVKSDDEAATLLELPRESSAFRMFRKRFTERLHNSLLFLDPDEEKYSDKNKVRFICSQELHGVLCLQMSGARQYSDLLSMKVLQRAERYELYEFATKAIALLLNSYTMQGKAKEFAALKEKQALYMSVWQAEQIAETLVQEVMLLASGRGAYDQPLLDLAEKNQKEVQRLWKKHNNYNLSVLYYRLTGSMYLMQYSYKKAIALWLEFEQYLKQFPQMSFKPRMGEAALNILYCYVCLRQPDAGAEYARRSMEYFRFGTNNWFLANEYRVMLLIHAKRYAEAAQVTEECYSHERFRFLSDVRREKWGMLQAYCIVANTAAGTGAGKSLSEFRLSRFLNDTPTFARDKRGFNVVLLSLQILAYIILGDFNNIVDKTDALRRYQSRYLKSPDDSRSNMFIRMVLTAEKLQFDKKKVQRRCRPMLEQLRSREAPYGVLTADEIMPFEHIWEIIESRLAE